MHILKVFSSSIVSTGSTEVLPMTKQSAENVQGYKQFAKHHPCLNEHNASIKCISAVKNKVECTLYFEQYRACMKKWRNSNRKGHDLSATKEK